MGGLASGTNSAVFAAAWQTELTALMPGAAQKETRQLEPAERVEWQLEHAERVEWQ